MEIKERIRQCLKQWDELRQASQSCTKNATDLIEEAVKEKGCVRFRTSEDALESVRKAVKDESEAAALCLEIYGTKVEFTTEFDNPDFGYLKEIRTGEDGEVELSIRNFDGDDTTVSLYSVDNVFPVLSFILVNGYDGVRGDV